MNIKKMITAVFVLCTFLACNNNTGNSKQTTVNDETMEKNEKALVVFFSHAGDNYAVGDVEVGNTKIVADYIHELIGADLFELVIDKYDGMAYEPLCELAKQEQKEGLLPEFQDELKNLDQYKTVFIGGPVWWGTYPQVMFTFFKKYDLSNKTLIPFTTHEGSGLGQCAEAVRKAYPKAIVKGEFAIYGHEVRGGKKQIAKWLTDLGYTIQQEEE